MTEIIKTETCFVKTKVENHNEIKQSLLELIESIGTHSIIIKDSLQISNSDWHLNNSYTRNYFNIFDKIAVEHVNKVKDILLIDYDLIIKNYWFQQYNKYDYHNYHVHGTCLFGNVYYVDLPEKSSKTSFKFLDKEFQIDVEEGDILTFPSSYMHCSKPNQSDYTKTVISFNIDV